MIKIYLIYKVVYTSIYLVYGEWEHWSIAIRLKRDQR